MLDFYLIILAVMGFNAALLVFLIWAFRAERFRRRRIDLETAMKVPPRERIKSVLASSAISLAVVLGLTYLLRGALFSAKPISVPGWLLQAIGILVVYDFAYYFMHRGMHHKKLMRFVHGVHHRAHNPSALESFYLHPAELVGGLLLLIGSTWLVGPVHPTAFTLAFLVYSTFNILIHSGLQFGHPLLGPIDFLTRKHYVHHAQDFSKNYSSLTPLPDLIFRSAA